MRKTVLGGLAAVCAALSLAACGDKDAAPQANGAQAGGDGEIQLIPDAALGEKYGAIGPRSCSTRKPPSRGAPSPEQAAKYVICDMEGESSNMLYMLGDVRVTQISAGRSYNPNEDINMGNIDVSKPVYAIRGSAKRYQCAEVQKPDGPDYGPNYHRGTNCSLTLANKADGACYVDTFGDWHCSMVDVTAEVNSQRNVAPPTP